MILGTVVDRHRTAPRVGDLLVLWQHPGTRQIVPIGRFSHRGETYSFTYTRAAAGIIAFRPLPGLRELHRRYESNRMPAVFEQRVMDQDRQDFSEYARTLGLDPSRATPWEQIVNSGGRRDGDTLQFMPVPTVTNGRAQARFFVNGIRHISEEPHLVEGRSIQVTAAEQERALKSLARGSVVRIEAEENNPRDPEACLVTVDSVPVGWVPQALSASIRELMALGPVLATVDRLAQPGTSPHVRIVLDLDVPAPSNFAFDRAGRWEPLVTD